MFPLRCNRICSVKVPYGGTASIMYSPMWNWRSRCRTVALYLHSTLCSSDCCNDYYYQRGSNIELHMLMIMPTPSPSVVQQPFGLSSWISVLRAPQYPLVVRVERAMHRDMQRDASLANQRWTTVVHTYLRTRVQGGGGGEWYSARNQLDSLGEI